MNRQSLVTSILTAILVITTQSAVAADTIRVSSIGVDGDESIYKVWCPTGYRTTVIQHFKDDKKKTCTFAYNSYGKETCRNGWSVDDAAAWACKKYR